MLTVAAQAAAFLLAAGVVEYPLSVVRSWLGGSRIHLLTGWRRAWSAPAVLYPFGAVAALAGGALLAGGPRWLAVLGALVAAAAWYRAHRLCRGLATEAQRERELSAVHLATIEALALAIDAKDKTSSEHIRRVQRYAGALATAAGLSDDERRGITTAALLHDIGKLAVPEHILSKPGSLTEEEFQKIHIHPQVGFEIIQQVPFPYPVAQLVLSHHERWDGKGYPLGLKGDDIPLGGRILAICDYFDSLTRDLPYHKGVTVEVATALLRKEAGLALDPRLVGVFLSLLPGLASVREVLVTRAVPVAAETRPSLPGPFFESGAQSAFENIARAHQEIYALYDIAQAIGSSLGVSDTMTLISSKLAQLVPFSCCALFVRDEDEVLRCRFATGVDADDVRRVSLPVGQGLAGWVTRNRRSLVNARPTADYEEAGLAPGATHLRSALVCPLVFNDQVIGTLSVYQVEPDFYKDDHRRLLDRISEQTAAAISNSIVFEQTREASLSDPLTGLPNTRFMLTHLGRELSRAERLHSPVAILVLDLDNFKDINDTWGHHIGDRALQSVARVLRDTIRPYDICIRYAGDEFIIVLADCDVEDAEAKRVELQQAIDRVAFEAAPGQMIGVSLSIGAAVFPNDGETYEALLATADGRMYRDKKARKRVSVVRAPRPVSEPALLPQDAADKVLALLTPSGRVS